MTSHLTIPRTGPLEATPCVRPKRASGPKRGRTSLFSHPKTAGPAWRAIGKWGFTRETWENMVEHGGKCRFTQKNWRKHGEFTWINGDMIYIDVR